MHEIGSPPFDRWCLSLQKREERPVQDVACDWTSWVTTESRPHLVTGYPSYSRSKFGRIERIFFIFFWEKKNFLIPSCSCLPVGWTDGLLKFFAERVSGPGLDLSRARVPIGVARGKLVLYFAPSLRRISYTKGAPFRNKRIGSHTIVPAIVAEVGFEVYSGISRLFWLLFWVAAVGDLRASWNIEADPLEITYENYKEFLPR